MLAMEVIDSQLPHDEIAVIYVEISVCIDSHQMEHLQL